jgi:hypothetical protein
MRRYITTRDIVRGTGLSLGTINNYMGSKILPHIKVGKARNSRVLFPLAKIKEIFPDIDQKTNEGT